MITNEGTVADIAPVTSVDGPSFEAFCVRFHPRLVGALALHCGDARLAEDLAQEALARACRDWVTVQLAASPEAWVLRVGMNLAASWFRRLGAARRHVPARRHEQGVDRATGLALRQALAAIPARQRQAVVLRFYADLSVIDAAAAMGCAEGTVRALTSQGLHSLRARLGEDFIGEAADD